MVSSRNRPSRVSRRPAGTAPKDASRWFVLGSLTLAAFMSTLDVSIVNVALAPISRDFGIAVDRLEWIVITYALTLVALTPVSGRVSDMLGRTRIFTLGFVGFIISSLLCSLAWNFPSLVVFRSLQGVSAAMFQGNSQAIITAIFPTHERGRAFGINSVAVGAGIVSGPVIGGLLTAWLGWRSIFWVNVPIGLVGFIVGRAWLPAADALTSAPAAFGDDGSAVEESRRAIGRESAAADRSRSAEGVPAGGSGVHATPGAKFTFDYRGAALFIVGIVSLMFGLGSVANKSWASPVVIVPVIAGAALLAFFARSQSRTPEPLMPPVIFQSPGVALGLTAAFISFAAGNASTFLTPYVMQEGLGFTVSEAGLVMTAAPLAMLISAPISGYLSDLFGPRPFTVAGLVSMTAGLLLLSRMDATWTATDVYWRLALQGIGWGLFNSPNWATIMGAVPQSVAGVTGGINATVRNLGNTTAVALAAAYFHWQSKGLIDPESLLSGYRTTLVPAALFAAVGLVPAMVRRLPDVTPSGSPKRT